MKYFVWIYIFLYISYIILGPHYISRLLKNDNLEIVDSTTTLLSRIFFLSYIAYLTNAYFFIKPNIITWLIAIIVNISALLGYIIKWFPIRNIDPYYWTGLISHILIILPVIFAVKFYNIKIDILSLKKNQYLSIIITIILLILYFIIQNYIYTDEKWKYILEKK